MLSLCLWEKWFIICMSNLAALNKRTELVNTCRHANKHLIRNAKLTNFLSNNTKNLNPNIMNLHKAIPKQLNKQNVEKVVREILSKIDNEKPKSDKKSLKIDISDIKFAGEERFITQMIDHLHKRLK